jgi:hypothetical protein
MAYKIEKSVPFPAKMPREKYPFLQMDVGDSFLVHLEVGKSPSSIYAAVSAAKKRLNANFRTARVEGGIRIWRVASASGQCSICGSSLFENGACGTCPATRRHGESPPDREGT